MNLKNNRVLITCGPTWVPIDDTRIISNKSSGKMAHIIARDFAKKGSMVHMLEGPVFNPLSSKNIKITKFTYYDELRTLLLKEVTKSYNIIIHAAAVSDYKPKKSFNSKINSNLEKLNLELVPTEKIIQKIKRANNKAFLVGFKLASKLTEITAKKKSRNLFSKAKCDLVVANSVNEQGYTGYVLNSNNSFLAHELSREALSQSLIRIIQEI